MAAMTQLLLWRTGLQRATLLTGERVHTKNVTLEGEGRPTRTTHADIQRGTTSDYDHPVAAGLDSTARWGEEEDPSDWSRRFYITHSGP